MTSSTVDRRYDGDERTARVAYQADASSMIAAGWTPVTERYVGEGWGKGHVDATYAWSGVPEEQVPDSSATAFWILRLVIGTAVVIGLAALLFTHLPGFAH